MYGISILNLLLGLLRFKINLSFLSAFAAEHRICQLTAPSRPPIRERALLTGAGACSTCFVSFVHPVVKQPVPPLPRFHPAGR
mmetsp:Transcript_63174/g.150638  ORF Transcript_63174/g.150638 Transcript_63174/m.150638 type:complete len:83 (-) Transcript_63174:812-1060(-)